MENIMLQSNVSQDEDGDKLILQSNFSKNSDGENPMLSSQIINRFESSEQQITNVTIYINHNQKANVNFEIDQKIEKLFAQGEKEYQKKNHQQALKTFKECQELCKTNKEAYQLMMINNNVYIGACYNELKKPDDAIKILKETHEQFWLLSHWKQNTIKTSILYKQLDQAHVTTKQIPELKKLYQQTIDRNQSEFSDAKRNLTRYLMYLGKAYYLNKEYQSCVEEIEKSLKIYNQLNEQEDIGTAERLNNIGQCQYFLRQFELSQSYFEEALRIKKKRYPDLMNETVAKTFDAIGRCYQEKHDMQNSLINYRESYEIYHKILKLEKVNHFDIKKAFSHTIERLAQVYLTIDDKMNALEYYQESYNMKKELYEPADEKSVHTTKALGRLLMDLRINNEALVIYEEVYNAYLEKYGPNHKLVGQSLNNLGSAAIRYREYDRAIDLFKQCIDIYSKQTNFDQKYIEMVKENIEKTEQRKQARIEKTKVEWWKHCRSDD